MTTFVDVAVVQDFFDGFPAPNTFMPALLQFRDGKISIAAAVKTWWYFPGLVSCILSAYAGDDEDHADVHRFCESWRQQHPHHGARSFLTLHEAWLAKAAVDTVISASKDQK